MAAVRVTTSNAQSLVERAYADAVENVDDGDITRARLLDAAYEQFCQLGIDRSSMEDVARRAGLSRITVYRKFESKGALVNQVILREFRRYFTQFFSDIRQVETVADRIVVGFVSALRTSWNNPLISELINAEPTVATGSIVGADGKVFAAVQQFVAGQLRNAQRSGAVSNAVDIELTAEMMVRVSISFLTIPSQIVDLDDDAQLAAVARRFLVPMLDVPAPDGT
ncbi:TetR/AcrR family transcriptional regulator [Hoyosella subflava]|uniref:Transcriptional regulator, TetR family n=1 Tax=Hoyosella subflava (strain DSM 45089 / JCM 17490 / NBRC 109087 / DQS3-9A1) TaxID=443218 RepID=F6ERF8_HOYSD|nr:TetR/AcrR family transcriptional regulator [Hoyosella subflava]AEF38478.1 Transcriptional regulator, TetR family [Hoyosella subflava DQS3-9A1]